MCVCACCWWVYTQEAGHLRTLLSVAPSRYFSSALPLNTSSCAVPFAVHCSQLRPPPLFCNIQSLGSTVQQMKGALKYINPLNAKLNPICHLLALLGAHHILHVSWVGVNMQEIQNTLNAVHVLSNLQECIQPTGLLIMWHAIQQWRTQEFFSGGGSTNSVEDRAQRERGSGGSSPLVKGSGGSCNLVQEISFHIVKFS